MHLRRENSMQPSAPERRTMRRFDMRLPASVRVAGNGLRDLVTETQNVSARGVFFYLDRPLPEGSRIEVTMTFPPHVTLTEPVRVRFTARVVRVEDSNSVSNIGVAAMIEEYEFLRSNASAQFSSGTR
jgi:PilZ domain